MRKPFSYLQVFTGSLELLRDSLKIPAAFLSLDKTIYPISCQIKKPQVITITLAKNNSLEDNV